MLSNTVACAPHEAVGRLARLPQHERSVVRGLCLRGPRNGHRAMPVWPWRVAATRGILPRPLLTRPVSLSWIPGWARVVRPAGRPVHNTNGFVQFLSSET
jgi:hypothetical protein